MRMEGVSAEEEAANKQAIANGAITMEMTFMNGKVTTVQSMDYSKMGMTGEGVPAPETTNTTGTYSIDGNKLLVVPDGMDAASSAPVDFKLDGNTLEITSVEMTMIFTRK